MVAFARDAFAAKRAFLDAIDDLAKKYGVENSNGFDFGEGLAVVIDEPDVRAFSGEDAIDSGWLEKEMRTKD